MKEGVIFNIQKFSVNDGPGIRTTVFMKGCPINCIWCHNPESKSIKSEIFYDVRKCAGCGMCSNMCGALCHAVKDGAHIYDRKSCIACGKCASVCLNGALEVVGKKVDVQYVIGEVLKDKSFYENSGGGMTLSGGEPMAQFEFSYELLKAAKEHGLHTCMETCGFSSAENFKKISSLVDIFLFDYKETNCSKHEEFTGVTNELILSNLEMLDELGCKIVLRCPIIPGLNDRQEHFDGIAAMAEKLHNILEVNIEPYHPLGSGKSDMLGKEYALKELSFPEESLVQEWISKISSKTSVTVKKS